MKTTAIIVDDEPKAISVLLTKIEKYCPQLEVLRTYSSSLDALQSLETEIPDIIFLDVNMPEVSGIEFCEKISKKRSLVIFTTAHNEHAIEAINLHSFGYLLKPIDSDLLISIVNDAVEKIESQKELETHRSILENISMVKFQDEKIAIPSKSGIDFVRISDIIYFEGSEGYTYLYLNDNIKILSSIRIGKFEEMLDKFNFFRIHKSYVVNLTYVKKYLNDGLVIMVNGQELPVSKNKKETFITKLIAK